MAFRFFALNRWQLTSLCNNTWMAVLLMHCVASNLFLFKECPKGDSSGAVF